MNTLYFFIEGPLGVGKTTLLNVLKEQISDVEIHFEPSEKWLDVGGHGNLYELYTHDKKRWACTAMTYVSTLRMQRLEEATKKNSKKILLVDRSVYCDQLCYAKSCFLQGDMSPIEWKIYTDWFRFFIQHSPIKHAGFIYLRAPIDIIAHRIKIRQRKQEKSISLEGLKVIYDCYENFFRNQNKWPAELRGTPVLELDATNDLKNDVKKQTEYIVQIKKFIQML